MSRIVPITFLSTPIGEVRFETESSEIGELFLDNEAVEKTRYSEWLEKHQINRERLVRYVFRCPKRYPVVELTWMTLGSHLSTTRRDIRSIVPNPASIEITGTDLTAIYGSLRKRRDEFPITGLEYGIITKLMQKLEPLNTLVDYTLEPKR